MSDELPAELDKVDALELENLQLKAERAQLAIDQAITAFQAKFAELGERYKFDHTKDVIHFASRRIERR